MNNTKTIKRFIAGFYSGQSYDIVGHGKTLTEALQDLKLRNMARAAQFEAEQSIKNFGHVSISQDRLKQSVNFFGKTYEQDSTFVCQEITEHFHDVENQLSNIVEEKDISLKYPLKWI